MAFAQAENRRPIFGAVATLGVSDRVNFLRKTYAHLGAALIAFAVITGGLIRFAPSVSWGFSKWALQGWTWLLVIGLFMVVGYIAERLARSETSRGLQYAGLGLAVAAEAFLLQPLLWVLMLKFGVYSKGDVAMMLAGNATPYMSGKAGSILLSATVITLAIFIGLTLTVFLTKKDFTFMRGALSIASFAVLGIILVSILFGFHLGALFCGAVILLMSGYILYQTSLIMRDFPPSAHVAAALMLFSTIATLFWYVLQLLMELASDR
ncbi:MAG: Bax inhibitor-1 family protein [Deltaproteobacteria bacterium]|nr:Bax inhibitor-1 family protein [Deltaproteobacteria bacterium]MCW5801662.1 Bax inhibitor-1 family protein [Deltaproteobacteria bacterium]